MNTDWKSLVKIVAPAIATAIGSPLAGLGVRALSEALLGRDDGSDGDIEQALLTATPDKLLELKKADQEFAAQMKAMDIDLDKAFIADTADARHVFNSNGSVFWLGVAILLTFAGIMGAVLWGSFAIMTGGITINDVAIVATVAGMIGTVVGYVAANAQQVVSYFFGSSRGSAEKTTAMADSIYKFSQK